MNKYIVELIGTFFLVLTVCMTVIGGAGSFAPLAIGSALMVMVYAGGHVSGGHYNPAVTLGVALRGACEKTDVMPYILAQMIGAALAVTAAGPLLAELGATAPAAKALAVWPSLLAELLGTFALVYVILNVATAKATAGNSYFGLAIGFTVTVCAYGLGGVSGGAFNPAVAFGATLAGLVEVSQLWIFMIANFAGGVLAAFVFSVTSPDE